MVRASTLSASITVRFGPQAQSFDSLQSFGLSDFQLLTKYRRNIKNAANLTTRKQNSNVIAQFIPIYGAKTSVIKSTI
jgi:hypothetical protein